MARTQISLLLSTTPWLQLLEKAYRGRPTYEFKRCFNIPLYPCDVWIIIQGVVQLSTSHCDGNVAILGLAYPEMPFGLPFTQVDPYEAIGLTDVELMRFSRTEMEASSELIQGILLQLNRRLYQTEALLALISQRFVSDRLQQLLLLLRMEMGEGTSDGVRLTVRLTHQQLAELTGTTRMTVTRLLGSFYKEGWLSVDKTRHMVIHDSAIFVS